MNELGKQPECFVAMWFGVANSDSEAEMNQLYNLVIKPAIEQQGLLPYQVGKDLKADKLDDAILEAIDRAVLARLCTNLVKSVRVTGRLHQALQIDPRDFYPLGIGR